MSGNILEIDNLSTGYGATEVIRDFSLTIPEGSLVTIIGPNGAGKSTLLNAVMGLLPARGGLRFRGEDLASLSIEARLAKGLCLVSEKRELFGPMSVSDNLLLGGYIHRADKAGRARDLEEAYRRFPRLRERANQMAQTLSGGERQMLALARALQSRPKLLLLDEPSLGLAPLIVREVLDHAAALRDQGTSVLLVEQNARAALRVADYAYVLEGGAIAMQGKASDLAQDPHVIAAYLGKKSA